MGIFNGKLIIYQGEDIANIILFLVSDESRFVSGVTIVSNGEGL
ncbi:hypothetical protein [Tissierella pigra]|nr:hypothetical protein [Tissierella pigra]